MPEVVDDITSALNTFDEPASTFPAGGKQSLAKRTGRTGPPDGTLDIFNISDLGVAGLVRLLPKQFESAADNQLPEAGVTMTDGVCCAPRLPMPS